MGESLREDELRPVPRERAVLESFFTQLGMFWFDRAKDYVEKEKEQSSRSAAAIWSSLLAALAHLAAAEKAYHSMSFLGQKLGNNPGWEGWCAGRDGVLGMGSSLVVHSHVAQDLWFILVLHYITGSLVWSCSNTHNSNNQHLYSSF